MSDQLVFSEDEVNAIYSELVDLAVPLDNDPVSFGPKRLNAKTADVRRMLDRVHRIYLDLSQKLGAAKRNLRRSQANLELSKNNLFANDPMTRSGRNVADREAIAVMKLKTEVEELNNLTILTTDLEAILTVVKAKHADLKDTEARLRDQVRLCGEELSLGSRWGSAVPNAPALDHRVATGADIKEIDDLLVGLGQQIDLAQHSGSFPSQHDFKFIGVKSQPDPIPVPEVDPQPEVSKADPDPLVTEEPPVIKIPTARLPEPKWESLPPEAHSDTEILFEVPAVDLSEILPAQATQSSADDFLNRTVSPIPSAPVPPKTPLLADPLDINDLLSTFEDVNAR